ncbi:MAG: hypothetical protein ACI9OJ_002118 [Myxococcota bacterium]|jgi:hypothetical protein
MKYALRLIVAAAAAALILPSLASACGPYAEREPFEWDLMALEFSVDRATTSGDLSTYQVTRLERRLAQARRAQRDANHDKVVTPAEDRRVRRAIKRTERAVDYFNTAARRVSRR